MRNPDEIARATFTALAESRVFREYREAFRKATGATLKLVKPQGPCPRPGMAAKEENPFCDLVRHTRTGCSACRQAEERALRRAAHSADSECMCCFAGLTCVAVPVVAGGRHVATLLSGQVFRREPTQRDFDIVLKMLGDGQDRRFCNRLRESYFATPTLTLDRFQAITELVKVYAKYLAEHAERLEIAATAEEPALVAVAKEFVQSHIEEPMRLAHVAEHAHVSPFYLCRHFKRSTGMTVTEYVTRLRVEKAKSLLADPSLRISEIVFAAGFGSIPRFNSAFKQLVGMPPSQYRSTLQDSLTG